LGMPDMRTPIAHALAWPGRVESGVGRLDFFSMGQLNFEKPDLVKFPGLALARMAAESGGLVPTMLNAANEEAVEAFLQKRLSFPGIVQCIEHVMATMTGEGEVDLESVLETDRLARIKARRWITGGKG